MAENGEKTKTSRAALDRRQFMDKARRELRKATSIVSSVADVVIEYRKAPSVIGLGMVGAKLAQSWLDFQDDESLREYLTDWYHVEEASSFSETLLRSLRDSKRFKHETVGTADGRQEVHIFTHENATVAFMVYHHDFDHPSGPYVQTEADSGFLRQIMWDRYDGKILLNKAEANPHTPGYGIGMQGDRLAEPYESEVASRLSERLALFLSKSISRSILLFGEPGTGKSTCCVQIAADLHGNTLRIPANHLGNAQNAYAQVAQFLQPQVLIIDDIDRADNPADVLVTIDELRKTPGLEVLLASANNLDEMDEAALRPGRFDEVELLESTEEVNIRLLQSVGASDQAIAQLKGRPVAYAEEYRRLAIAFEGTELDPEEEIERLITAHQRTRALQTKIAAKQEEDAPSGG